MRRRGVIALGGSAAFGAMLDAGAPFSARADPRPRTAALVQATRDFLSALGDGPRSTVLFAFDRRPVATAVRFRGGPDGALEFVGERYGHAVWSNFPVGDVPRPGLRYGRLDPAQRVLAMRILRLLLSEVGYRKMRAIMGSDQTLSEGGTPYPSGEGTYTIGIFGDPSETRPWMVQFGGHHLGLNAVISGERGVLAPVMTGALPALSANGGETVRVLAGENDKAFALLHALADGQRREATIDHRVSDLELGPGHDGEELRPEGLKASGMTGRQRELLLDLIGEWVGIVNEDYAAPRMAEIRAELNDTFFAWSGPATHAPDRNGASHFRIRGPSLAIEFSPQEPGGDLTMHVHSVYRDTLNAYGRAFR